MNQDYDLLMILQRAAESAHGVAVVTTNPTLLRNRLYKLRKTQPSLAQLSFVSPPVDAESRLWIVRRDMDAA